MWSKLLFLHAPFRLLFVIDFNFIELGLLLESRLGNRTPRHILTKRAKFPSTSSSPTDGIPQEVLEVLLSERAAHDHKDALVGALITILVLIMRTAGKPDWSANCYSISGWSLAWAQTTLIGLSLKLLIVFITTSLPLWSSVSGLTSPRGKSRGYEGETPQRKEVSQGRYSTPSKFRRRRFWEQGIPSNL